MSATGPQEWADAANDALKDYIATQHLIGTQLVEVKELTVDDHCQITTGSAYMESYLQAWHQRAESVWIFFGTYVDEVVYVPGKGWRIAKMNLIQVSDDDRPLGRSSSFYLTPAPLEG